MPEDNLVMLTLPEREAARIEFILRYAETTGVHPFSPAMDSAWNDLRCALGEDSVMSRTDFDNSFVEELS